MNRPFAPAIVLLCSVLTAPSAFAQAKPASSPPAAPAAAPGKFVAPVKGAASVEVIRGQSKRVGKEIVTPLTIKNMSTGSINLLRIDELWYNKKREMITSTTERYKKPFLPGEVIQIELKSPLVGEPDVSQLTFSHANGTVNAKTVKKFE